VDAVSPYSRRTGKRYAAGSHATFEHYPRVCSRENCPHGGKIVMAHNVALWFETAEDGVARSWHHDCRLLDRVENASGRVFDGPAWDEMLRLSQGSSPPGGV
jgi:hypothetical protein